MSWAQICDILPSIEKWHSLPQVCVDMLLQHGTEGKPQVVPTAVKGEDAAAQCAASKSA